MPKPRMLDLFCGAVDAASLSDLSLQFPYPSQQATDRVVLVVPPLRREFQVGWVVVVLVVVPMVDLLNRFKASAKSSCHNQPMLIHIPILISHRRERAISGQFDLNVPKVGDLPAALPVRMVFPFLVSFLGGAFRGTRSAKRRLWLTLAEQLPSFLGALITTVPNIPMVVHQSDLCPSTNVTNLHAFILAHNGVDFNG